MTRKKAIFYIKELQKTYASMDKKVAEAVDMAIEALSAEPKIYGNEHNCVLTMFGECSYDRNGCGSCEVVDKIRKAINAEPKTGEWIPFTRRPMTEEEQKDYPNCTFMFDCDLPDDGDEILVSNRRFVWMDTFCNDIDGCYLDGGDDIDENMAWMPLPTPYKGGDDE